MALAIFDRSVAQTESGETVPFAEVTVNSTGDFTGLSTLWLDRAGTISAGNPLNADSDGRVKFYVSPGRYNIAVTSPSVSYPDVIIGGDAENTALTIGGVATNVGAYLNAVMCDDYADVRAQDSSKLADGQKINVSGFESGWEVKTGTVIDDGWYIVFSDDSNRYAESESEDYLVDIFESDGTRSGDSSAIRAAIVQASGSPIKLLNRRYLYDGAVITDPILKIHGTSMPSVNSGKTALENGSIIDGTLGFTSNDVDLRDFGVDVGSNSSSVAGDAIRGTATLNAGGSLHTENIVGLCKSETSPYHALLFQSYLKHTGGNLLGVYGLFGFVTKSQNVDLGLIHSIENDESGILLKSDTGFGRCENVSINRAVCECHATQRRGFHIQSSDAALRNVNIDSIKVDGAETNVLFQVASGGVDLRNIKAESILSLNSSVEDVVITSDNAAGAIFNIDIGNIVTQGTLDKGFRVVGGGPTENVNVGSMFINYDSAASQATMNASCFVGGNCDYLKIEDLSVIRNFSLSQIGGITYNNASGVYVLGSRRVNIFGVGRPNTGVDEPAISGASVALTIPENESGGNTSFVRPVPASGTIITSFVQPVPTASNFAKGHILIIENNSVFNLTINHNIAGFIANTGSSSVVLAANEASSWVFAGSVWHQI